MGDGKGKGRRRGASQRGGGRGREAGLPEATYAGGCRGGRRGQRQRGKKEEVAPFGGADSRAQRRGRNHADEASVDSPVDWSGKRRFFLFPALAKQHRRQFRDFYPRWDFPRAIPDNAGQSLRSQTKPYSKSPAASTCDNSEGHTPNPTAFVACMQLIPTHKHKQINCHVALF